MFKHFIILCLIIGIVGAIPTIHQNEVHCPHKDEDNIIEDITTGNFNQIKTQIDNSIECAICEYLVREGEDFISKNFTEDKAINFLKTACHHIPKEKQNQCEQFISNNYDKIIQHIIDKESAPIVCSQLNICKNISLNDVNECTFCKYSAHKIETFMHSNRNLMELIEFGENFCDNITYPYNTLCANIMPIYYSEIVGKLIERNTFVDICETMHLCQGYHTAEEHLIMDADEANEVNDILNIINY